jgi:hypothetical protein
VPKPVPKKPVQPSPVPKAQRGKEREIKYPNLEVNGVLVPAENTKVTVGMAEKMMGWETETQYADRIRGDNPKAKESQLKFKDDDVLLKDFLGQRVAAWRNANNREFDKSWCLEMAHCILKKQWRMNLETIVVSKYGNVTSGQHRLAALILASQMQKGANANYWEQFWGDEEVYINTLVAFGGEEDQSTLATTDNTRPRTPADYFYTSPLFKGFGRVDRSEASRMLSTAVDLLWVRTRVKDKISPYKSNLEVASFVDRHKKLIECVRFIFDLNKERAITSLPLYAGHAAALLYLMGCSGSDGEVYRNQPAAGDRSEKKLDWATLDKAKAFWKAISEDDKPVKAVRLAPRPNVGDPVDSFRGLVFATGGGGTVTERLSVLVAAWNLYDAGRKFEPDDLRLRYHQDVGDDGNVTSFELLTEGLPVVEGIDEGVPVRTAAAGEPEKDPNEEEVADEAEAIKNGNGAIHDETPEQERLRRQAALDAAAKIKEAKAKRKAPSATIAEPGQGKGGQPAKPPTPKLAPKPRNKRTADVPVDEPLNGEEDAAPAVEELDPLPAEEEYVEPGRLLPQERSATLPTSVSDEEG